MSHLKALSVVKRFTGFAICVKICFLRGIERLFRFNLEIFISLKGYPKWMHSFKH